MPSYNLTRLASEDFVTDGSTSSDSLDSQDQRQFKFGRQSFPVLFAISVVCLLILGMSGSGSVKEALKTVGAVQDSLHSGDLKVMINGDAQNSPAVPQPSTPTEILEGPWDDAAQKYMSMHKLSRGERLVMGGVRHVYHQTSMEACKSILKTGFKTGIQGIIGDGIYFAERSIETGRKTRHYGCMIEVLVRFGRVYNARGFSAPSRDQLLQMGFDSVTVVDTRKEHYGREFEIYHKDQIVDMFAYPCMGRWTQCVNEKTQYKCKTPPTGERTGENLDGKTGFDLTRLASSADYFRSVPIAKDILTAPDGTIAV